jgi:hypothetical protein
MKVFLSWSGHRSGTVAKALRDYLPDMIQEVKPWMSRADIQAGARWSREVQAELSESRFGIICLTRENQIAPWILFEAGALAKTVEGTFVCPYLIDLKPSEILEGPLTQFQSKEATKEGTLELVKTINQALKDKLPDDRIDRLFNHSWPNLESVIRAPVPASEAVARRTPEEMIEEILVSVRDIKLAMGRTEALPTSLVERLLSIERSALERSALEFYQSAYQDRLGRQIPANALALWANAAEQQKKEKEGDEDQTVRPVKAL